MRLHWRTCETSLENRLSGLHKAIEELFCAHQVGLESLESTLVFSGMELPTVMAQHCAIIVDQPSLGRCVVYDFLPESPTSPATAAALLSGGSVTGVVRSRAMKRVPPRRCTCIGLAAVPNVEQVAEDFNSAWDKRLKLFKNDCRNYSKQLARCLLDDQEWQLDDSLMPPLNNPLRS